MLHAQLGRQFVNRQIGLRCDPAQHPLLDIGQLAISRVTLLLGIERSGLAFQAYHIVHELDRNAQPTGRLCMRASMFYKRNCALSQLNWMRFAHICSKHLPQEQGITQ